MTDVDYRKLDDFYIPNLCNGSISIVANVSEVGEIINEVDDKIKTVEFSVSRSAIEIEGNTKYELVINTSTSGGKNLDYLEYIPAFYSSGSIIIDAVVGDTFDDNGAVNLTFDIPMYIADEDKPDWYPYSLALQADPDDATKEIMCDAMSDMEQCPQKDAIYESISANTSIQTTFSINSWIGFRPIVPKIPPYTNQLHVGCLPPTSFKLIIYNNIPASVILSNVTVSFKFSYDKRGTLMDLGNKSAKEFCQLYCGPNKIPGDAENGTSGPDRWAWAIIDGYDGGIDESLVEVKKVFGYFNKTSTDRKSSELMTFAMEPMDDTGSTSFPPFVYRSYIPIIPKYDNDRMVNRGFEAGEKAWPVTQAVVCQSEKFKRVKVTCEKPSGEIENGKEILMSCSPSDPTPKTAFYVKIELRDDIDEFTCDHGITIKDFNSCIKTMKFFNVDVPYTPYDSKSDTETRMKVLRSDIDKTFYDTLALTYENAVVLKSNRGDIEPFTRIKINSWDTWIPIYNGKSIQFNESLTRCTDGVRSRELFYFGDETDEKSIPNVIKLDETTEKRYNVGIEIRYQKYTGMHVHKYIPPATT